MQDLNAELICEAGDTGWSLVEYWVTSIEFWDGRVAEFGDVLGYGAAADSSRAMLAAIMAE